MCIRDRCKYDFPGNVRELENGLERAFVLSQGARILPEDLPPEWQRPAQARPPATESPASNPSLPPPEDPQKSQLEFALASHQWNRTETAKALGIGRNTLWRRMKAMGLAVPTHDCQIENSRGNVES